VNGQPQGVKSVLAKRLKEAGESAFAAFVRKRSDAQLERTIGSRPGLRLVFKGMERAFIPEKANGFKGEVQYELTGPNGGRDWILRVDGDRATTAPGRSANPVVTFRMSVPVFARLASQEMHPAKAMMEGDLSIDGDFEAAARLGEMFGADSLV
jgi:putative sterol carrier protein